MDLVHTVALSAGLAWASGMRLYAVLFAAGLLARLGYLDLPGDLAILQHPLVLIASGLMLAVEFFADKIPLVDSFWDSIHTFIRIPAGAVLAAMALGNHDPAVMVAAGILGGTLSAGTHLTKAGGRALINTSPEPFSNIATSLGEDVLVAGGLYSAIAFPVVFLILLSVFIVLVAWLLPKIWQGVRMAVAGIKGNLSRINAPGST